MVDFLRANPFISKDEYMYELSIPMITLMSIDFTHVEYLSDKQVEANKNKPKEAKKIDLSKYTSNGK